MTDTDIIEQRVRSALRAVADEPIGPTGAEPGRGHVPRSSSRRRARLLAGAVAAVVVLTGFGLVLAYGPRSATTGGSHPPPVSQTVRGAFRPVSPASPEALGRTAATMRARLLALGAGDARVTVRGGRIDVTGRSVTGADLRAAGTPGTLLIRPVECGAPGYAPVRVSTQPASGTLLPACGSQYQMSRANLGDSTSTGTVRTVAPDPMFSAYPSTSPAEDASTSTVLLPDQEGSSGGQAPRYVLGPAELDGSGIAGAVARQLQPVSVVELTLTPRAAARWDIVAEQNFHMMIAVDVDGEVISAPIIEPVSTAFVSLGGKLDISGNFSAGQARALAVVLGHGPLAVAVAPVSP